MRKSFAKRIAAGLLALALLCALAGCGGGGSSDGGGGSKGEHSIQIGIMARGYGDQWLYKLAEAFQKKTGIKTEVIRSSGSGDWIQSQLQAGPNVNQIDIIFDINPRLMRNLAVKNYVPGYDRCFADLSDIYGKVPEGYGTDKTLKELINPTILKAVTWGEEGGDYGDGKQYFASYVAGIEGLVYNPDLFEKYNLDIPLTTNQLLAVMDKIKTLGAKNKDGRDIYPYVYSGKANYSNYLGVAWWAQYDGMATYGNMLEGKDAAGNYSAESVKAPGKLSAMQIVEKILDPANGYTSSDCFSQSFTDAQVKFLDNQAFMMSTGDWLEREMEGNFSSEDINPQFMRIPVNSDIVRVLETVKTEEQLVESVKFIDGEGEKPSYLSDADIARLKEARGAYCCEGTQHVAWVPAYSDAVEECKQFLLYMYSKEGQEIMLQYADGNMAALSVDASKFDYYGKLSGLQRSKLQMQSSEIGFQLVGNNYYHPMAYAGGVETFYNNPTMENAFGVVKSSASHQTPAQIWQADYENMAAGWADKMSAAGVAN